MNRSQSAGDRAVLLEKMTKVWAGIEAVGALLSGILPGSFALFAFGAESGIF